MSTVYKSNTLAFRTHLVSCNNHRKLRSNHTIIVADGSKEACNEGCFEERRRNRYFGSGQELLQGGGRGKESHEIDIDKQVDNEKGKILEFCSHRVDQLERCLIAVFCGICYRTGGTEEGYNEEGTKHVDVCPLFSSLHGFVFHFK